MPELLSEEAEFRRARRIFVAVALVAGAALLAVLVWLFNVLVQPAPPRSVVMSTGAEDGAYHAFALRYREHLRRYGVNLVLKPSKGSIENLERLRAGRDGVQIALVQGGLVSGDETESGIVTLGSMFYEPVWLFWHGVEPPKSLKQFYGKRIAVGAKGSGTRPLALSVLGLFGVDESNARISDLGGLEAAEALIAGRLDAAFFVNAPEAAAIQRLMYVPSVQLLSAQRADAYVRRFRFLSKLVLPAGAVSLARDVPKHDTVMLAVTANLLVSEDLHPVIVDLLLEATRSIHGAGNLFESPGEFPAIRDRTFPVSPDAERNYRGEFSFLRKYLPFWVAIWIQRFAFFAIPLLAIGIPLFRYAPMIYNWGARRRIYRWYGELKFLEMALRRATGDISRYLRRLEDIEESVNAMKVPLAYSSEYYTLRMHIGLVRQRMDNRRQSAAGEDDVEAGYGAGKGE